MTAAPAVAGLPRPGERYLDRRGRTIEIADVRAATSCRPTQITLRFPFPHRDDPEREYWSLLTWQAEIAVGPLVEADAA